MRTGWCLLGELFVCLSKPNTGNWVFFIMFSFAGKVGMLGFGNPHLLGGFLAKAFQLAWFSSKLSKCSSLVGFGYPQGWRLLLSGSCREDFHN